MIGEGHFDDTSNKPSGTATPIINDDDDDAPKGRSRGAGSRGGKGISKKAKTKAQKLAIADGL